MYLRESGRFGIHVCTLGLGFVRRRSLFRHKHTASTVSPYTGLAGTYTRTEGDVVEIIFDWETALSLVLVPVLIRETYPRHHTTFNQATGTRSEHEAYIRIVCSGRTRRTRRDVKHGEKGVKDIRTGRVGGNTRGGEEQQRCNIRTRNNRGRESTRHVHKPRYEPQSIRETGRGTHNEQALSV